MRCTNRRILYFLYFTVNTVCTHVVCTAERPTSIVVRRTRR